MIEQINKLIEVKISNINTVDVGMVTKVDLQKMKCNVKLKHKIGDNEIELYDVPIALFNFGGAAIISAPSEGDVVLVLFSKFELNELLKNKNIVKVNELYKFSLNNAVVIAGLLTEADNPPTISKGQLIIKNGDLEIKLDNNKITLKAETIYLDGDVRFKKIFGVNADSGTWHSH